MKFHICFCKCLLFIVLISFFNSSFVYPSMSNEENIEIKKSVYQAALREDAAKEKLELYRLDEIKRYLELSEVDQKAADNKQPVVELLVDRFKTLAEEKYDLHNAIVGKAAILLISADLKLPELLECSLDSLCMDLYPDCFSYYTSITKPKIKEKPKPTDKPVLYLARCCGEEAIPYFQKYISNGKKETANRLRCAALLKEIDEKSALSFFEELLEAEQAQKFKAGISILKKYSLDPFDPYFSLMDRGRGDLAEKHLQRNSN